MLIFKKILLIVLCIVLLTLTVFMGYRMISAEAKLVPEGKSNYYIEYKDQKYYGETFSLALPDNYELEDINEERLTYYKDAKPLSFITFSIYGIGNSSDMFYEPNYGVLGSSIGYIYIRENYIFPTVQNDEVSYIELDFSKKESIIFTDEKTVNEVVEGIKNREDISKIFSIEEYGAYRLLVHYKGAPVCEYVGAIWDGKYMYLDEYDAWTETDEFKKLIEPKTHK